MASLDPATLRSLDARTRRALRGYAILCAATLLMPPMLPMMLIFAAMHYVRIRALRQHGVCVTAELVEIAEGAEPRTAEDFLRAVVPVLPGDGGPYSVLGLMRMGGQVMKSVVAALGRLVPIVPVRYRFPWDGRTITAGCYMLYDEEFLRDASGARWVVVDPRVPRLSSWMVSRG